MLTDEDYALKRRWVAREDLDRYLRVRKSA